MIEKRAWTRDELLAEVSRAVRASLHPQAEALIAEIERRVPGLRFCGTDRPVQTSGLGRFCLFLERHEGPHRGITIDRLHPDLHACCEASPIFTWED